ncbi:MAG: IS110 family transposase [Methylococcales bacterium]|nr:IS110 family transposase [Methylococcales bacterium]
MYAQPEASPPGQRGRRRKCGNRLGSANDRVAEVRQQAKTYTVNLYGKRREVCAYAEVVMLKTRKRSVRVVWVFRKTQCAEQYKKIRALDAEIKAQDQRINRLCNANNLGKRFLDVPGVGPLTATIVAADIGDSGKGYKSSRDYAASLGVVPKQHSSTDKQHYLGISKRGNRYIRTLLIHGARAVLKKCTQKMDKLSLWLQTLVARRGFNKAAVALANKNARILWAMASNGNDYEALAA